MNVEFSGPLAMINSLSITPSPMDRGNGPETRPGIEPLERGCNLKLPTLAGALVL